MAVSQNITTNFDSLHYPLQLDDKTMC